MNKYTISCYKLWWQENDRDLYVGSTKQALSMRMAGHRQLCKTGMQIKLYEAMRINGLDFHYVLLESYEINSRDQQMKWEQHWIDKLSPNLNQIRAYCTVKYRKQYVKQYRNDHKDEIKIYRESHRSGAKVKYKQYYESNKNNIKVKKKQSYYSGAVKAYRENHKDEIKVKRKQYREKNRNEINRKQNTKIKCECESVIAKCGISVHRKSQTHKNNIMFYLNLLPFNQSII